MVNTVGLLPGSSGVSGSCGRVNVPLVVGLDILWCDCWVLLC